jgi:hypothetical protein
MKGRRKSTHYVCMPRGCPSINSSNAVSLSTATGPGPVMIGVEATRRVCGCADRFFFSLHLLFACHRPFASTSVLVSIATLPMPGIIASTQPMPYKRLELALTTRMPVWTIIDRRWRVTIKLGVNPQSLARFPTRHDHSRGRRHPYPRSDAS